MKVKKISMLILLPKNKDLQSVENSLSLEKLNEWRNSLEKNGGYLYTKIHF